VIWPVYLLDAFVEVGLIVGWVATYLISRRATR
jgi:hypothetical protein